MTWGSSFGSGLTDPDDRVHDDLHESHATAVRERERCLPGRTPWQTFLDKLDYQADKALFQPVAPVFENVFRLTLIQSALQFVVGVGLLCTRDELCVGWLNWWLVVDAAVTAALLASDHAVRYQLLRAEINWKNAGSFYQERPRACTRNQWDAMRANQQRSATDHDSCAGCIRLVLWMPLLATFASSKLAGHIHFWTTDPRTFQCGLLGSNLTTVMVILQYCVALHALAWYLAFRTPPPLDVTYTPSATLSQDRGRLLPDGTYLLL